MEILTSFFSSGTGLTIVAIIIVLAVIGGIALLLRIVRRKHKKSLAFYLILFAVCLPSSRCYSSSVPC